MADAYAKVDARDGGLSRLSGQPGQCHHHIKGRVGALLYDTGNIVTLTNAEHDAVHAKTLWVSGDADGDLRFEREGIAMVGGGVPTIDATKSGG